MHPQLSHTDRYHIWKKNCPLLYNQLLTTTLLWPSLSIDWLPDSSYPINTNNPSVYYQHRLLLSTYSNNSNSLESILLTNLNLFNLNDSESFKNLQNFDYNQFNNEFVYSLNIPSTSNGNDLIDIIPQINNNINNANTSIANTTDNNQSTLNADNVTTSSSSSPPTKINNSLGLSQRIPHINDINKMKHCPSNPDLIATSSNNGNIRIFDRSKKPTNFTNTASSLDSIKIEETCDILLDFHKSESWTLDWNPINNNVLASGSNDGSIAIWNLKNQFNLSSNTSNSQPSTSLSSSKFNSHVCTISEPESFFPAHDFGCNEIKWIHDHDSLLVSVGEDKLCKLWDIRQPTNNNPSIVFNTDYILNTLDIDPFQSFNLISGTSNGDILFLDLRSPTETASNVNVNVKAHDDSITATKYSPHLRNTFASSSDDSTVKIWNTGTNVPVFVHGGHMMEVNDFSWCPQDTHPHTIASTANDNSVHVWEYSTV